MIERAVERGSERDRGRQTNRQTDTQTHRTVCFPSSATLGINIPLSQLSRLSIPIQCCQLTKRTAQFFNHFSGVSGVPSQGHPSTLNALRAASNDIKRRAIKTKQKKKNPLSL